MRLMPRTRWGVAWRGILALVVVVGCAAGATATGGLLEVKNIANGFKAGGTVDVGHSKVVTLPAPGKPETLFLIGVDCRPGECGSGGGNTDTMMLVRIDDSSSTVNLLSIPRDLAVQIPGFGVDKLNAAYADGGKDGSQLLLETLRDDVFPKLRVNHIMIVDFSGFAKLINEIGCVYGQVDRRYYNHSIGPEDPTTNYSSIDIQPGYQKMCGGSGNNLGGANTALAFVRFRHNDSDFVRQARQQDFIRWAKQNYSTSQLVSNASTLFNTFSHNVQTDHSLHTVDGIDDLIRLAVNANGSSLKSIPYPDSGTETINGADDVILNQADAEQAYRELMTPTPQPPAGTSTTVTTPTVPKTTGKHKHHARPKPYVPPARANMIADPDDGTSQAAHLGHPGLPVYYPKYIPEDYAYCFSLTGNCNIGYEPASAYASSYPRHYAIDGFDGKKYPSYVMTLSFASGGQTDIAEGQFINVQGTTWPGAGHAAGPPILRAPSAIKIVNHKVLYEYSQGGKLTVVAWKTNKAVYWISNNLQNMLPNDQMVAMAASLIPAHG
jgi:polyisoprenyl-teichoic acid--peptidoglycan teichoic acid transferase